MNELAVTVYCTVYNHEKYLRQCLDSFVHQETDFRFTVLVHDDASTDGSADIIREYATAYPDIIIPILQEENQRSKKVRIVNSFIEPRVTSKYVAICEGDDYWTSSKKLQMQYDAMENNPDCGLCIHRTSEVTEDGVETGLQYPKQVYETGVITAEDLFDAIEPRMFHTSSFFLRADLWHQYIKHPPLYKQLCSVGDVPIILYFGSHFPVYQINEVLSCYRRGGQYSWTNRKQQLDETLLIRHHTAIVNTYRAFDTDTEGRFHQICVRRISKNMFAKCALTADFSELIKRESADYRRAIPSLKRASVYFGLLFPKLMKKSYFNHLRAVSDKEKERWYGNGAHNHGNN